MKTVKIIQSNTEPDKNHLWLGKDGLQQFKGGKWSSLLGNTDNEDSGSTIIEDNWELINEKAYGIEWQVFGQTSPDCTRIGNMEYHKTLPCHQWKGCIAKAEKIQYYLDPTDWSKKEDGTEAKLDGTDGTVRVHIPKFYYKSFVIDNGVLTKRRVMVAPEQIDSTWIEFPDIVLDAYYATLDMTNPEAPKAASVINTTPEFRGGSYKNASDKFDNLLSVDPRLTDLGKAISNLTLPEMSNFAKNADAEVLCYDFYKMIVFWMPCIEYATLNLKKDFNSELTTEGYAQGGLSKGCIDMPESVWRPSSGYNRHGGRTPNGFTNEFGNNSGVKILYTENEEIHKNTDPSDTTTYTAPNNVLVNRYRGIENLWGDMGYILEGIIVFDKIYNTSNPINFTNNYKDREFILENNLKDHTATYPVMDINTESTCELLGISYLGEFTDFITLQQCNIRQIAMSVPEDYYELFEGNAFVFGAGGFSSHGGLGSPGFLAAFGSLDGADDGGGFRSLSRLNGDSKKLQYREII